MFARARKPSSTLAVAALVTGALVALPARAEEAAVSPATSGDVRGGHRLALEEPHLWNDAVSQSWVVRDRLGRQVCTLPCAVPPGQSSGYVLEGVGTLATSHSFRAGQDVVLTTPVARFALPDAVDRPHEGDLLLRVSPGKGNPDAAVVLGVVSGVVAFIGGVFVVGTLVASSQGSGAGPTDGGGGSIVLLGGGIGLVALGATLGTVALVWGLSSERPKLVVSPLAPSAPSVSKASPPHLTLSPAGLVGSF